MKDFRSLTATADLSPAARMDTAGPPTGVNCHQPAEIDSELATLIAAWAKLPDSIRTGIVAMVQAVLAK